MVETSGLGLLDVSVIALLLISGILAFIRGLVRELFALTTWVGAVAAVIVFFPLMRPWMGEHIKNAVGADAATALTVFALALLILIPLGIVFSGMVKGRTFTSIDSSLGFLFGVARGWLILSLVYLGATWIWPTPNEMPKALEQARVRPLLAWGAEILGDFMPKAQEATKAALHQQEEAQKAANIKRLEDISVPLPAVEDAPEKPAYQEKEREQVDEIVEPQDPTTGTP